MANEVVVAIDSANPKLFNNGIGAIMFPVVAAQATLNSGSCMQCNLPHNAVPFNAIVVLASVAGAALFAPPSQYSLAYISETSLISAKALVTLAAITMNSTGYVQIAVVM